MYAFAGKVGLLTVRVMVVLVHIAHTAEAAVSFPAKFRAETSTNTAAAVAGFGTGVILFSARVGVGRPRRIDFGGVVNELLAILVRTASLKGEASVAAALVICCTSACSCLALSLALHCAGTRDGEKQYRQCEE